MKGILRIAATSGILAAASAISGCDRSSEAQTTDTNGTAAAATAPAAAPATNEAPLALAASAPNLQWGPCPEGMPQGCGIAVLHGDPAKPNADIFLRVRGGSSIPPHTHTSAERMILVSGELAVTYKGSPAATLRTGNYAYGPAGMPHRADCRSSEPCTLFIAFEGPVDVLPFEGQLN